MLLAEGAAIDIHNSRGETALDAARARGTRKSILLLEKMYAQKFALPVISTISPSLAESSLIQAVRQEDEILLDSLLCSRGDRSSIDLEERDDWFGRTPLLHAALVGHLSILRKLCSAGANIHAQDVKGLTALHIAATMDLFPMALYLLREGADAATEDYRGLDALSGAKTISLQVLLLEYGAPIRHFHDLRTLLFLTAKHGSMKVVQRLVQAGAYGHLKDRYGRSAYGEAKRAGRTDVARYLFKMGGSKAGSSSQSHTSSILPSPNDTVEKHASETRACTSSLDGESDIVRRDHDHMLLVADISQTSSAEPEASDKAREQTQEQPAMQAPPISKRSVPTLAFPRNTAYINVLFVVVLFTLYLDGYHLLLRALSMV
jgi:ankyrin repeat protein